MREVYAAKDEIDAHLIQTMLAAEGVGAVVQGGTLAAASGGIPFTAPGVCVLDDAEFERARSLIEEFKRGGPERALNWTCAGCGEVLNAQFGQCWKCGKKWTHEPFEQRRAPDEEDEEDEGDLDASESDADKSAPGETLPPVPAPAFLKWEIGVVLLLTVFVYWFVGFWHFGEASPFRDRVSGYETLLGIVQDAGLVAILLYLAARSGEPWGSFGLGRFRWIPDIAAGVIVLSIWYVLSQYSRRLYGAFLEPGPAPEDLGTPPRALEYLLLAASAVASGFTQELLFRGYFLTRIERLSGSATAAVLLSSLLFSGIHAYQGGEGLFVTAVDGIFLGTAFCVLRRVWPLALAHALFNLPILMRQG